MVKEINKLFKIHTANILCDLLSVWFAWFIERNILGFFCPFLFKHLLDADCLQASIVIARAPFTMRILAQMLGVLGFFFVFLKEGGWLVFSFFIFC